LGPASCRIMSGPPGRSASTFFFASRGT